VNVPPSIGPVVFGTLGVGWVMVRCPQQYDDLMRRAGGVWEPGARQWLVERRRIGPARLLIPLTRGHGGAALQFEIEMKDLDQLDQFRRADAGQWMHAFSEILIAPPEVAILRVDDYTG